MTSEEEEEPVTSEEDEEDGEEEGEEEEEAKIMPPRLSRCSAAKQTLDIALGAPINGFTTAFSNTLLLFTRQINDLSVVLTGSLPTEPTPRHCRNAPPPQPPKHRRPRLVQLVLSTSFRS